jgi:hypothetical protein
LYKKGELLTLAPRIRDIDRQYEYNNNCELDNGVYNKFMVENLNKSDSKSESIALEEHEPSKLDGPSNEQIPPPSESRETELEALEDMIK